MQTLTYWDIYIPQSEQKYIDSFQVDYWDADIYPGHWPIVNHIIDYIAHEMIDNLEISDESKDKLRDAICPNSIATTINAEPDDFPLTERETVQKFIESF